MKDLMLMLGLAGRGKSGNEGDQHVSEYEPHSYGVIEDEAHETSFMRLS
jgi:hypothetical protein